MSLRRAWLIAIVVTLLATPASAQPSVTGQWTTLPALPFFPINIILMPSGKVMMYPGDAGISGDNAILWDPATASTLPLAHVGYDLFCTGHAHLADGRVLVAGGHIQNFVGLPRASIYDSIADRWTPVPDMNAGRWYPTLTTLPNGDVLVTSGDIDTSVGANPLPQVFQVGSSSWRDLTNAQLLLDLYPYMHVAPNGLVFNSGPAVSTRYLDPSGTGAWTSVADRTGGVRDYGGSVMYAPGKLLVMGGGDPPQATAEVIDLNEATPTWRAIGPMAFARRHMNSTILPDGTVLVTGGTSGPGSNNDTTPVFAAELWNPTTQRWTTMASASVPRLYHSAALLLPDGRVVNTGGNGYQDVQVFEPPYLFKGARPTITGAPGSASYGSTVLVQTPDAVARVTLIRLGAVTHTNDMDARFLELPFTAAGSGVNVTLPAGPSLAPPGYYMIFVLNGQGVPSIGRIVQLGATTPGGPSIVSLTPGSAPAGGPAFTLTVDGGGFAAGASVQWNGAARSTTVVSPTRVTASIAAADIATVGTATVRVVNPGAVASNPATFTITGAGACPTGQFFAEYFNNVTLSGTPVRTACETAINYDWGSGGPAGLPVDNFSVRWSGRFMFVSGSTIFTARADDGVRLFLDGVAIIDQWRDQPATTYTATSTLTGGEHDVKVEYYERGGLALAQASWSLVAAPNPTLTSLSPTSAAAGGPAFTLTANGTNFVSNSTVLWNGAAQPTTFVSATQLTASIGADDIATPGSASVTVRNADAAVSNALTFTIGGTGGACPTGQFLAEYFSNVALTPPATRTACESAVNYDFGAGGPAGLPVDNFSARWTGRFQFAGGNVTFTARADDGVRVFVDGVAVIDQWRDQPATTYTGARALTAGEHEVKVEYYERGGDAVIQVSWTGAGTPGPTLSAITPSSATAGGAAFTLVADGANFASGATVLWNGAARGTTVVSATRVTATIPAGDIAVAGSAAVAVRNLDGQVSNALTFTIGGTGGACPTGQFLAEYFSNVALTPPATRTACENAVNYDFGAGGPAGLPVDNFSARWTGRFQFAGGSVTFTARADDGVRVFVDGVAVIDQWRDQPATTYSATSTLSAGQHEVKVEYYERGGDAVIQVSWTGTAGTPGPTLSAITPSTASAGGPGFTLTATGSNFGTNTTVLWNGSARTTSVVSGTQASASIPASDIAAAGSASVTVRNGDGQVSNAQTFTVNPASGTVSVFITAPADGATVSGDVWFTVWIENAAVGSKTYTLSAQGATITSTTTTSNGPVSLVWSTSASDNGSRTATVTVRDSAGGFGSGAIKLTVAN